MNFFSLTRLKALIIDDDPIQGGLLKAFLTQLGHTAVVQVDPKEALMLAEEHNKDKQPFNIAFIDYIMPRMNGIQVSRKLKKITPHIFNIAITGFDNFENKRAICGEESFDHTISKSMPLDLLENVLLTAISTIESNQKK